MKISLRLPFGPFLGREEAIRNQRFTLVFS
jgi:hypothetical protein